LVLVALKPRAEGKKNILENKNYWIIKKKKIPHQNINTSTRHVVNISKHQSINTSTHQHKHINTSTHQQIIAF